jgi:small subunit ribosomal protein S2
MKTVTIQELFEAGVHYGHARARWNPKMAPYLFGVRNGTHIIDITKTIHHLNTAMTLLKKVAINGGRVLFVGTKMHAAPIIKETADACGQYYVNHRWLGGMLTNWKTVALSIKRLEEMEKKLSTPEGLTKKEQMQLERKREKLERVVGGVRKMGGQPDALVVIDTLKEKTAILEANRLGIPVIGIVDSNSDPDIVKYLIPGNDDAIRAIRLYCDSFQDAILTGLRESMKNSGVDLGTAAEVSSMEQLFGAQEASETKELA